MASRVPVPSLRVTRYSRPATAIERGFYGELVYALADRRKSKGITQEQLDLILGVGDGQVAKWEAFDKLPGAFTFMCWCNALDLKLSTYDKDHGEETYL